MIPYVAAALVKWVYTDAINMPSDQDAIIELLAASNTYRLTELKLKWVTVVGGGGGAVVMVMMAELRWELGGGMVNIWGGGNEFKFLRWGLWGVEV